MYLYKNAFNILLKYLIKFEVNSMSIEYSKSFFKQYNHCFHYFFKNYKDVKLFLNDIFMNLVHFT
jgi:hypothetical protein